MYNTLPLHYTWLQKQNSCKACKATGPKQMHVPEIPKGISTTKTIPEFTALIIIRQSKHKGEQKKKMNLDQSSLT